MLKLALLVLIPITVLASQCHKRGLSVLKCSEVSLEELTTEYEKEEMLELTNITGNTSWNTTKFSYVNTVLAENLNLSADAVQDLMKITHLSTLEIKNSYIDWGNSSSLFTSEKLRSVNLKGSLNDSVPIFNFTFLTELDLSGNILFIVPTIEGEKIVYLNLSGTFLKVVNNLEKIPLLEELDLSDNNLLSIDEDAFQFNPELDKLWLQKNHLTNINFSAPLLKVLNLNDNNISIIHGSFFTGVPNLTTLYLVGNSISTLVHPFKNLGHLKMLDMSTNEIASLEGKWFRFTPELEVLRMSNNNLKELPTLTGPLDTLHHLNISHNALRNLGAAFFKHTPKLAVLDVSYNELTLIDATVPYLGSLNKLYAAHNALTFDEETLAGAKQLNFLDASQNGLDITLDMFGGNNRLRDVILSDNEISHLCDEDNTQLFVQNLDIRNNKVRSLECLKGLTSLSVEGNPLDCNIQLQNKLQLLLNSSNEIFAEFIDSNAATVADVKGVVKEEGENWQYIYHALCPAGPEPVLATSASREETEDTSEDVSDNSSLSASSPTDKSEEIPETSTYLDDDQDENDDDDYDEGYHLGEEEEDMGPIQSGRPGILGVDHILTFKHNHRDLQPWATWAFILLGVCMVLLLANLLLFVWYQRRARVDARLGSDRPYEQLNNEVYKDTTSRVEGSQRTANLGRAISVFKEEKLSEILVKFGFRPLNKSDSESQARMIPTNQMA